MGWKFAGQDGPGTGHQSWFARACCWLGLHTFTVVSSRVSVGRQGGTGGPVEWRHHDTRWCPVCGRRWVRDVEEGGDRGPDQPCP
jgi:hypothetical protein